MISIFKMNVTDYLVSTVLLLGGFGLWESMCDGQLAAVWISEFVSAVISSWGGFRWVPFPLSAVVVVWISGSSWQWEPQGCGRSSGRFLSSGSSGPFVVVVGFLVVVVVVVALVAVVVAVVVVGWVETQVSKNKTSH